MRRVWRSVLSVAPSGSLWEVSPAASWAVLSVGSLARLGTSPGTVDEGIFLVRKVVMYIEVCQYFCEKGQ